MKLPGAMKLSMFSPRDVHDANASQSPTDVTAFDESNTNTASSSTTPTTTRLGKMFSFATSNAQLEAAPTTEQEIKSCSADVSLVDGVDDLIANKSDQEACILLLRRMVTTLTGELEQKEQIVATLEQEKSVNAQDARSNLFSLMLALQKATGDPVKVKLEAGQVLSSEEATSLVISSLTNKISELSEDKSSLVENMTTMHSKMQDLESENEACLHKIDALEMQFKTINKTRQRVVSRLVDKSVKDHPKRSSAMVAAV